MMFYNKRKWSWVGSSVSGLEPGTRRRGRQKVRGEELSWRR